MTRRDRVLGLAGLALQQLRRDRARTVFAVLGVAFAVLTVTLLVGVGVGVLQTGEERLEESGRDLWVTGGAIEIQPSSVGGFSNPIPDAHELAAEISARDDVAGTVPMAFQVVYVSADGETFDPILGAGVPGTGGSVQIDEGRGFSAGTHYAGGAYDGPMSHEVIVDPGIASAYNLSVGDTLHVGGSITNAERNPFEVVGVSPTFRSFLGTQTAAIHLSELQTLTGTAYDDRATLITVRVVDGEDPAAVAEALERAYPGLEVRTNREQLTAILERQALVIAGGLSLAILGVLAGVVLSLNLSISLLYNQRADVAVLRAVGGTWASVVLLAVVQVGAIAVVGGALGIGLSPLLAAGLDSVAASLTGFEGLVNIPPPGYLLGAAVALGFGVLGAVVGALRVAGADLDTTLGA